MKTVTTIVTVSENREQAHRLFSHDEVARIARVPVRSVLKYWKSGLIQPRNDCERYGILFDEEAIYRIRKAETIRISHPLPSFSHFPKKFATSNKNFDFSASHDKPYPV